MTTMTPLSAPSAAPVAPELGDAPLRDAVRALAHVRVQAAHEAGELGGRWRDDGDALAGEVGAAVAREVAALARAARIRGAPVAEVLVAVAAAVRAAGAPMEIGPREAMVRDAARWCVKAFYDPGPASPTPADAAGNP